MIHNILHLKLQDQYFHAIVSGIKTVEGRLNSPKFKDVQVGMSICFSSQSTEQTIVCLIEAIHRYQSFKDMLLVEGISNMLPGVTSLEQAIDIYESFPGYKDKVILLGAIAIKIQKVGS
jgi:ASC-1-like (ASCH) protein